MPVVRVYLPLSATMLRDLATRGRLAPAVAKTLVAYAATPVLVHSLPAADVEDQEYAAYLAAVDAASALRESPGHRRLVVAADVEETALQPADPRAGGERPAAVVLTDELPLARVASFHIDEDAASRESGDDDLLWYDVTEIDAVRGLFD